MCTERQILCGGGKDDGHRNGNGHVNGQSTAVGEPLRLRMWGPGAQVHLKSDDLARPVSSEIPSTFADLIEIATYVYVADQAVTRGGNGVTNAGADWRRHLPFRIPVRNATFWRSPEVMATLVQTLGFLSEDEYHFEFTDLADGPPVQHYLPFPKTGKRQEVEEVVLFSGGLDSVAGAVQEVIGEKRAVALVNHRPTEKLSRRHRHLRELLEDRARDVGAPLPVHVPVHINKDKGLGREYTQRSRSFLYASIAATVAQAYALSRIRFYENGVVSLNFPLSPQVVGAKATRTTHPRVLRGFARLFSLLADRDFRVENPFTWKTKADVVQRIVDGGCGEMIRYSTSCTHTWEQTNLRTHCGTCSQCIDRRFAVLAAGAASLDPGDLYGVDLLTGPRPEGEDRTMLAAYVETASRVSKLSATDFFARYGEIGRVVNHLGGSPDVKALQVYQLYQRHGEQVGAVIDGAISRYAAEIRNRELRDSCLLRLVCDASPATPLMVAPPSVAASENVFRKKGQAWTVRFNGGSELILLPSKGAAYLHLLLTSAGQSLSAVTLAFQVACVPARYCLGDAGERTDKEAQTAYRARCRDLSDELEAAKNENDEAAAMRLQSEMDDLVAELRQRGWVGRAKRQLDDRDRVRKSVGAAIRRAVAYIAKYDPALAKHLQSHS